MIGYVIRGRLPCNRVVVFQYWSFDTWKVCVRYIAMVSEVVRDAHDSIVLPEVSVENFEHAWKRFRLAAPNNGKKKSVSNFADIVAGQCCGILHGP